MSPPPTMLIQYGGKMTCWMRLNPCCKPQSCAGRGASKARSGRHICASELVEAGPRPLTFPHAIIGMSSYKRNHRYLCIRDTRNRSMARETFNLEASPLPAHLSRLIDEL